ncbi:hypothetical protein Godav_000806 [Gossypium davidsonii]|uniref:Uncharacterized protein n=1 Tax=Gossypium davidsonii TaxID=34287 RepID=A0A7J8T191_GOSDV|nr:hypothetical protein [Gossypium davidsonii]
MKSQKIVLQKRNPSLKKIQKNI